jgi:D-alanine-D-alanine ligase
MASIGLSYFFTTRGFMKTKVAVLMGGWSSERDVSLSSAAGVIKALTEKGYSVTPVDVVKDLPRLLNHIQQAQPQVIFNALHGVGGEDGVIQGVLEMLQIPYTHSGLTASAVAMNKIMSRKIFKHDGLPIPAWKILLRTEVLKENPMEFPYVIKPIGEGSSRGVSIVRNNSERLKAFDGWTYGDHVLVEEYIPGHEIQVAVVNGKATGAIEICPKTEFYDYEAKYTDGLATHIMPAPLSDNDYQTVLSLAEKAYQSLHCRGVARVDFRFDDTKTPAQFYILELNTQPGMTPLSLVPEIMAHCQVSFSDLVHQMVQEARCD